MITLDQRKTRFNIGVMGFLNDTDKTDVAHVRVASILSTITERVLAKEYEYYKTPQDGVQFDFYTSPLLAGDFWASFCIHWNMGEICAVIPEGNLEYPLLDSPSVYKTTVSSALKGIAQTHTMVDWIACQIDIAFALWDGNEASHDGSIWMFIERCKQNGIPCIWIDTTNYEKSFWFKNIYPEPFNRESLWQYIDGFYINEDKDISEKPKEIQPHGFLFSKLWGKISSSYERCHGIQPIFDETKKISKNNGRDPVQFEDTLLRTHEGRFNLERLKETEEDFKIVNENFEFLREAFHDYEDAADRISPYIRAALYCRTWVPLLSTIFLAVGFYVETIMRFLTGKKSFMMFGRWSVDAWAFIAGIGFLISAYIFFYNLKNKEPHQKNIKTYIVCRYVDEYFRIVLHYTAYGLPVSERILNKAIRNTDDHAKRRGAVRVRRLLRMRTPSNVTVNNENCIYMIKHLNEFFDSQISYQEIGRKKRFFNINENIKKWIKVLLWVNLTMLAFRGVIQFIAGSLPQLETLSKDSSFYWLSYNNGGKNVIDFARSFANMTALMITACYDKYSRQKDMNHYDGYYKIADKILKELYIYKAKVMKIKAHQEGGEMVSYDWFRSLAEDSVESLTSELYWWCDETSRG